MLDSGNLSLPIDRTSKVQARIAVVGEIIWDIFQNSTCLGGAPLNFSVNCRRLGHSPLLLSAVGTDELGERALRDIAKLGLEVGQLQRSRQWKTGTASVKVDAQGLPTFHIDRPAAYDDLSLSDPQIERLRQFAPSWLYFGTLFPALPGPRVVLDQLMQALPRANRFYDVNLRPGFDSPDLIATLITQADVVKLNETEAEVISRLFGLPSDLESFCRNGSERFGWKTVCITLGEQGCAILRGHEFCRAEGLPVRVADTVGAGDAFAAALLHGLVQQWPVVDIAQFANRVGALVASRTGAIPAWDLAEVTVRR